MSARASIRRRQQAARSALVSRIVEIVAQTVAVCFISFLFAWIIINWISGCGEAFPQADGSYIQGECIMHPWRD